MAGLWLAVIGLLSWLTLKAMLAEQPNTEVYDSLSKGIQEIVDANTTSCQPFAHYEVSGPVGYRDPVFKHIVADIYYCKDEREREVVSEILDSKGFSTSGHLYMGKKSDLPEYYFEEFADVKDNLIFVYGEKTP